MNIHSYGSVLTGVIVGAAEDKTAEVPVAVAESVAVVDAEGSTRDGPTACAPTAEGVGIADADTAAASAASADASISYTSTPKRGVGSLLALLEVPVGTASAEIPVAYTESLVTEADEVGIGVAVASKAAAESVVKLPVATADVGSAEPVEATKVVAESVTVDEATKVVAEPVIVSEDVGIGRIVASRAATEAPAISVCVEAETEAGGVDTVEYAAEV